MSPIYLALLCPERKLKEADIRIALECVSLDSGHEVIALLEPCPHCGERHKYTFEFVLSLGANAATLAMVVLKNVHALVEVFAEIGRAEDLERVRRLGAKP